MRFRNLALTVTASIILAGAAIAQVTKSYLPGCGPAQGMTFLAELAARQDALADAQATTRGLRKQLAALTDQYNNIGCKPGMAGLCAELSADLRDTRSDIRANSAFTTAMAAAVDAYRRQQPFVTPAGEACLRCKSPGDFNCLNPGLVAGFSPQEMPKLGEAAGGGSSVSSASSAASGSGPSSGRVGANLQPWPQPQTHPQSAPSSSQRSGVLPAQPARSSYAQASKAPRRQGRCCAWTTDSGAKGCVMNLTVEQCQQKSFQHVWVNGSCEGTRCVVQ